MDLTQLPYELQFQFLLNAPQEDILHYCASNRAAYQICQSYDFWNLKAKHDVGLPLGILRDPTLAPDIKYLMINNAYHQQPENLIGPALRLGSRQLLTDLIQRSYSLRPHQVDLNGLLEHNEKRTPVLMDLIHAGPEVVQILLSHNSEPSMQREIYILSEIMNRPDVRDLVSYNPREDLELDARYFTALNDGDIPIVLYLRPLVDIDPVDDVYVALASENPAAIRFVEELYGDLLYDEQFLYQLMAPIIQYDDLNVLRKVMTDYGTNLNLEELIELMQEQDRPELAEYLREIL